MAMIAPLTGRSSASVQSAVSGSQIARWVVVEKFVAICDRQHQRHEQMTDDAPW
jgi:hypothetical protein